MKPGRQDPVVDRLLAIVLGAAVVAMFGGLLVGLLAPGCLQAQPAPQVRIDTFDKYSRRGGYAIVNPETGRIDFYDKKSRHTGSGQISPPPAQTAPGKPSVITPYPGPIRSR